jgi:carboxypeptidase C (cathepsin A)
MTTTPRGVYDAYFASLGYTPPRDYVSLNMDANNAWDFPVPRGGGDIHYGEQIGAALRQDPALRLYVGYGYYDLAANAAWGRWVLAHSNLPAERVSVRLYEAGHALFAGEANHARVTTEVRAFIQGSANAATLDRRPQ